MGSNMLSQVRHYYVKLVVVGGGDFFFLCMTSTYIYLCVSY